MEQWLIEGNFSQDTILTLSSDMMTAGVDSVNLGALCGNKFSLFDTVNRRNVCM